MTQIVQDFKLPEIPEKHDLGKTLNNVAFGKRHRYIYYIALTHVRQVLVLQRQQLA